MKISIMAAALLMLGTRAGAQSMDMVVVANKQAATVSLLDAHTGHAVATLPVGVGPHEVATSADGRWAVVSNYGAQTPGNSLTVIDLDRRSVARTIDLGEYRRPHGMAFIPGTMRLVVTSEASQNVVVVDVAEGRVERAIPTGQRGSHMLAMTPDGSRAFTANIPDGTISEVDLRSGERVRTSGPLARVTEGIAISPDGRRLWLGSNQDHTVTVVDAATLTATDTLLAPGFPYRAVVSADGRRVVVPNPMANLVRVFDAEALREIAAIQIPAREGAAEGGSPVGVAVSPDSRRAFVSLQGFNQVGVIDLDRGVITAYWDVGDGPDGIAYAARR